MIVVVKPAALPAQTTTSSYARNDFGLVYEHQPPKEAPAPSLASAIDKQFGIQNESDCFVSFDTLTLVFSGRDKELVAFDSYTNWDKWTMDPSLRPPPLATIGRIFFQGSCLEGRVREEREPVYRFSADADILEIRIGPSVGEVTYYRLSDRLIAGTYKGSLHSLLLEGLEFK